MEVRTVKWCPPLAEVLLLTKLLKPMKKRLLKKVLIALSLICIPSVIFAQSAETLQQWATETFDQIENDFRKSGSNLYTEVNDGGAVAFNWPQGIQFHAFVGAENIDRAEAMAHEIHDRYWCYHNNRWAYNASADGCGDRYYDDNAWIACGLMELHNLTNNNTYLTWAKEVIAFSMSGENPTNVSPGGGIKWKEGNTEGQCNCATAPTILANGLIYNATNEAQYLTDGIRLYNWMKANRWRAGGGYRGYENATLVSAALELFKATGDQVYISDAQHQGLMMESAYVNQQTHALHETGQWGGHDMSAAYRDLYEVDGDINWLNIATGYLGYLHDNCKDGQGRYPENWNDVGATGPASLLYQASVARGYAEIGNTRGGFVKHEDAAAIFYDANYSSYFSSGLWVGDYTLTDLERIGWLDNKLTSLKVASGYKMTIFRDDNFQGESLELTEDVTNLGAVGWNDAMSSLKVEVLDTQAIVYQHCVYNGRAVHFPVGNYSLEELQKRGVSDNSISSMTVGDGYKVIFYIDNHYLGAKATVNSNVHCMNNVGGADHNDKVSSLKVRPVGTPGLDHTYFIQNRASGLYMDVNGGVSAITNGDAVIQSTFNGNENQQFELTDRGDGTYSIIAKHSGKGIDVQDVSMTSGALIQQWDYVDGENQRFILIPTGNGYYKIMAEHSGFILDVSGNTNGEQLKQWWNHNGANAQWLLKEAGVVLANYDNQDRINEIIVFPNPAQNTLHIQSEDAINSIELMTAQGKQLQSSFSTVLDVSNLTQGVYFVKVNTVENSKMVSFIKN